MENQQLLRDKGVPAFLALWNEKADKSRGKT
jgi:hypothetical protein